MKLKLFAVLALLAGSTSLFAGPRFAVGIGVNVGPSYGYYVAPPPPPPVVSYAAPVAPAPGYSWVNGYYYPAASGYVWRAGYWARPPYRGAYWVAPRYYGHRYYGGYWRR